MAFTYKTKIVSALAKAFLGYAEKNCEFKKYLMRFPGEPEDIAPPVQNTCN